jgi:hypothetical protein
MHSSIRTPFIVTWLRGSNNTLFLCCGSRLYLYASDVGGVWVKKKYFRQCNKEKNWKVENWNFWRKVKDDGEKWGVKFGEKEAIEELAKRGDVGEGREKEKWLRVPK